MWLKILHWLKGPNQTGKMSNHQFDVPLQETGTWK